ncbi:2-oxoacid:ferredoxin oxidoreductase subunit gamma [Kosmotoga arenicorallina S304]|uniref:2-oxoacid:ferredoxin oxidoreductase subunit gamma n=1 Tax=Kosmotoga arenicorallina S304 TaxID=1453497 RepID=A0A176K496_9BACT|nr:2-oxoacid:acceptor oxidoreductase family protein [Kosmotoga arenicorallina]OAA31881.1 2-oxoacid:ferredoxin oxidoreductase subunit gamma [Kosmotoga arenicorallina S304]
MSENILIAAGFGGQGIMLLGQILATAAMYDNKHSTWLPSYGPEMRGGTANCTVVINDEPIGSPVTDTPGELIIMNIPSLLKFEPSLKENGLLILNTSVVDREPKRQDIDLVKIDANKVAEEIGSTKISNMVMLGAYIEKTGAVTVESVEKALRKKLTGKKAALIELNLKAIESGIKLARK